MLNLYEESDLLHNPFECFYCDSKYAIFPISPHWHYYMELVFVLKGTVNVHVENKEYIVSEGEMIVLHPKLVHAFYLINNQPVSMAGIKLDINSMTFTSSYSPRLSSIFHLAQKKKESILIDKKYVEEEQIKAIFHNCISETENNKYGYDIIIFGHLYHLLILIIRYWQNTGFTIDAKTFSEEENYDIFNILPYISNHLDSNLRVNDIAASCGLSYSYFAKKFLEVYGKSCKEYIEDMRIYKAEELLLFTDFDLSYISQLTGFSDCSHLIKSFKQHKNITPKQFRMLNNTNKNRS